MQYRTSHTVNTNEVVDDNWFVIKEQLQNTFSSKMSISCNKKFTGAPFCLHTHDLLQCHQIFMMNRGRSLYKSCESVFYLYLFQRYLMSAVFIVAIIAQGHKPATVIVAVRFQCGVIFFYIIISQLATQYAMPREFSKKWKRCYLNGCCLHGYVRYTA